MLHQYSSKSHIYKLTDLRNDKIYIGKHKGNQKAYFTSGNIPLAIIKKHGKKVFKREIIVKGNFNNEMLNQLEMHYIRLFCSCIKWGKFGYNLTEGGDGVNWTKKDRLKMSKRMSGEGNHMYGIRLTGSKNGMFGRSHTEESKRKMSENSMGRIPYNKGISQSKDQKEKQSQTMKRKYASGELNQWGENNPMYGKPAHNRRAIMQFTLEGIYIKTFDSATQADKETRSSGSKHAGIGKKTCCNGFIWIYEDLYSEDELKLRIERYLMAKDKIYPKNNASK